MSDRARMVIRAEANESAVEIDIYDVIVSYAFFDGEVTALDIKRMLDAAPGKPVTVNINSGGGDVAEATAIYAMLGRRDNVTINIDGLAASAATLVAMAGDTIKMAANAWFMIHDPFGVEIGGADEMRGYADLLDRTATNLAQTYAARTGKPVDEIRDLMKAESWLTAEQALDYGFITDITPNKQVAAMADPARFKNVPAALAARFASAQPGTPPELKPTETAAMPTTPAALTPAAIKAACPKCDDKFVVEALESGKTLDAIKDQHLGNLAAANENLHAELSELKASHDDELKRRDEVHADEVEQLNAKLNLYRGVSPDDAPAASNGDVKPKASFRDRVTPKPLRSAN